MPAVDLPKDQINVLAGSQCFFSRDLWSFLVNFIKINFFLLHKQLANVKDFGAIWGSKQQNFTFGGLTVASVGEFSWVSWSIEVNFIKINTFLLHKLRWTLTAPLVVISESFIRIAIAVWPNTL